MNPHQAGWVHTGKVFFEITPLAETSGRSLIPNHLITWFHFFFRIRFRCDCGQMAVTVILVTVGVKDSRYTVRLPLCPACLEIEKETQAQIDRMDPPSLRLST